MRVADEPNVALLRQKARVLESENERMSQKLAALLSENLALKGMSPEAIAQNLPGLLEQVTAKAPSGGTRSGSERRPRNKPELGPKKPQKGHGPTPQPDLETVPETFDLDEADQVCPLCAGSLQEWAGAEDTSEIIEFVERKWIIKECIQKKYRCPNGCTVVTADGPDKLIKGGRYGVGVAVDAAIAKYDNAQPLRRQVKIAQRQGIRLTTQALWDQILALAIALAPLCERIRRHILGEPVLGVDLTGFSLIEKGGSKKKQVWQLSCPTAIYFEMLDSKKADDGERLFMVHERGEEISRFTGIAMMDGAAELLAIANKVGFDTAGCWSHGRRNVRKANQEAPGQVDTFLDFVDELYEIDRKAARDPPPDDDRRGYRHRLDLDKLRQLRDTESRAVCKRIENWILEQSCIPGGLLKAGLDYIAKRWTRLTRFLDDPRIPLDSRVGDRRGGVQAALGCVRRFQLRARLGRAIAPFPVPATSNRAGGFPAPGSPRRCHHIGVMGLFRPALLSVDRGSGSRSRQIDPRIRTRSPYSTSSSRIPFAFAS